jgi:phosphoserine aminotransferase
MAEASNRTAKAALLYAALDAERLLLSNRDRHGDRSLYERRLSTYRRSRPGRAAFLEGAPAAAACVALKGHRLRSAGMRASIYKRDGPIEGSVHGAGSRK